MPKECDLLKALLELHLDVIPEDNIVKLQSSVTPEGKLACVFEIDTGSIYDESIEEFRAKAARKLRSRMDIRSIKSSLAKSKVPVTWEYVSSPVLFKKDAGGPKTFDNIKNVRFELRGVKLPEAVPEKTIVEAAEEEIEKVIEQAEEGVQELSAGAAELLHQFAPDTFERLFGPLEEEEEEET